MVWLEERTSALLAAHTDRWILDLRSVKINNSGGFVFKVILCIMSRTCGAFFLMKNMSSHVLENGTFGATHRQFGDFVLPWLDAKTHIAQVKSD
jgi:hypothetical protein